MTFYTLPIEFAHSVNVSSFKVGNGDIGFFLLSLFVLFFSLVLQDGVSRVALTALELAL